MTKEIRRFSRSFNRQVDVRKHRGRVVRIVEPDLLEPDVPLDLPQLGRVWCILNVDL